MREATKRSRVGSIGGIPTKVPPTHRTTKRVAQDRETLHFVWYASRREHVTSVAGEAVGATFAVCRKSPCKRLAMAPRVEHHVCNGPFCDESYHGSLVHVCTLVFVCPCVDIIHRLYRFRSVSTCPSLLRPERQAAPHRTSGNRTASLAHTTWQASVRNGNP